MNYNFADYDLTKLLPAREYDADFNFYINPDNDIASEKDLNYIDDPESYDLECWTWEDIRLYLKSKGISSLIIDTKFAGNETLNTVAEKYYVKIKKYSKGEYKTIHFAERIKPKWQPVSEMGFEDVDYLFDIYEEARREAIIYCLNLINNDPTKIFSNTSN